MTGTISTPEYGYATLKEARAVSYELLRLTMTETPEDAALIRNGRYMCFTDSLPGLVEARFVTPPLNEIVEASDVTEVGLQLRDVLPRQDILASVVLQRSVRSTYATALIGVHYDVFSQAQEPYLRVTSSLSISPSEPSPTSLGISAEGAADKGLDWPASDLSSPEAQLCMALQVAYERAHNPLSHEGLDADERAKLSPRPAFSSEALFWLNLYGNHPICNSTARLR